MAEKSSIVFVNIGFTFSEFPIMQKVMIYVNHDLYTPEDAARKLRRIASENLEMFGWDRGPNFTPEVLYYEIYGSIDNNIPFSMSWNSPYRRSHVDGRTTS